MGKQKNKGLKTKVQHFYDAGGRHLKSLKYYANEVCEECGKDVLRVQRHGKWYVLDAEKLYLLKPNCLGLSEVYTKEGVRHRGTIVKNPQLTETYIVGYLLHKCGR